MIDFRDIVPYTCVYLDACWSDFFTAIKTAAIGSTLGRKDLVEKLEQLFTNRVNKNHVLPTLSVRTGLDLFLQVKNFPPGSEMIMSAINIPDMAYIVRHHDIKVVPLDVHLETCAPKVEQLESLITEKTVGILLAHLYGKWFDMNPFIEIAQRHNLYILEDCAEGFRGFQHLGHPETDVSLFSFGAIKYYTAFGGGMMKIKDVELYKKMNALQDSYPVQKSSTYVEKVLKLSMAYSLLNCVPIVKGGSFITKNVGFNERDFVVKMLRGFPDGLIQRMRHQPPVALLYMLYNRLTRFDMADFELSRIKGEYVSERLPDGVTQVGNKAEVNNYWLFPIVVDNPDEITKRLNNLGLIAYRGATQLSLIEPTNGHGETHLNRLDTFVTHYPHEAKFLIDHVLYLPVNKTVPFYELDRICEAVQIAMKAAANERLPKVKVKVKSKL